MAAVVDISDDPIHLLGKPAVMSDVVDILHEEREAR
jgi:hypothetical protein